MTLAELRFDQLLQAIAARTPTPGGGAVTAAVAAIAAALGGMVVSYSVGKKSLAEHEPRLREALARLERARAVMLELAEEDAAAYGAMNDLLKLPEADPRRAAELPAVADAATRIPLALIATSADVLRLFDELAAITNRMLRSDLAIAAVLAEAAARASRWNIAVNLPVARDLGRAQGVEHEAERLLAVAAELASSVEQRCR
ncbi:MAG: cyclodeaminase/cyclohydrolase family protein [Phycisphaerales bacterium]|nr:cyclodeaminase/cyclohydrolase family protein [Phycisphaerales bacterium]